MNPADASSLTATLQNLPYLGPALAWLLEPPGLYVGYAILGVLGWSLLKGLLAGGGTGGKTNIEKSLQAELKIAKKAGNFEGMGSVYERLGDKKRALEAYRRAGARRQEAGVLLDMGDREGAKKALSAGKAWDHLAKLHEQDKEHALAAAALEKAGKTLSAAEAYEKAGDKKRAAALYSKGGISGKAGELLASEGGPAAAELIEKELRSIAIRSKGAPLSDAVIEKLRRCLELWQKQGEHQRAFRLAVDLEQWKLAAPIAIKRLDPSVEGAQACVHAGDHLGASSIYEKLGEEREAALLRARHHQAKNERIEAARWLEKAGEWAEAADTYGLLNDIKKAAELYARAGDNRQAADSWLAAGEPARAAPLLSQAEDYAAAADAYKKAGDTDKQVEMLQAAGEFLGAGVILKERGLLGQAIEALQKVAAESAGYSRSRMILGEIFLEKGERKAARAALERGVQGQPITAETALGFYNLGRVLETEGDLAGAAKLYDQINAEQYGFRDVAMRLRDLSKGAPLGASRAAPASRASEQASYGRTMANMEAPGAPQSPSVSSTGLAGAGESRYVLEGEIGRGGMGVVYKATDRTLKRAVAYKALPADLQGHPKAAENLLTEARAAAQLSHPNVVQVYDAGKDERGYFIVMELVEGEPFDKILRGRKLSVAGGANVARQICAALSHAHSRRIVHRDLKPSNLIWTKDKQVKLMDFGLARAYQDTVGKVQTRAAGTPYYMAPEQIRGEAVSPRTDIYALGCVLYEILCNRPPFTDGELTYHHVSTEPQDPRKFRPEIPEELAKLVLKCLAKKPEDRPATADEVSKALAQIAAG